MHRHRTSTTTASIEDLHLLWGDATGSERCGTKVLDTVLFRDARPTRWLFTNKHSQVAKKKDGNLKLDRIHDRFLRLANVGPKSKGRAGDASNRINDDFVPVALVYTSDGASTSLTKRAFEELLESSHDGKSLPGVVALQAVVQVGNSGREAIDAPIYRVTFRRETGIVTTKRLTSGRSFADVVAAPSTARAEEGVKADVRQVVQFLESSGSRGTSVRELAADFVMDDKHYLWLSRLHRVDTESAADNITGKENAVNGGARSRPGSGKGGRRSRQSTPETGGLPKVRGAVAAAGTHSGVGMLGGGKRPASEQSQRSDQLSSRRDYDDLQRDVRSASGSRSSSGKHSARGAEGEGKDDYGKKSKKRKDRKAAKQRNNTFLVSKDGGKDIDPGAKGTRGSSTVTMMPSVGPRPSLDGNSSLKMGGSASAPNLQNNSSAADGADASTTSAIPQINQRRSQRRGDTPPDASNTSSAPGNITEVRVLKSRVTELDETISKMQARLSAEATVNARLTERLRTLRENMTKAQTDGEKSNAQQLAQMKQAIRAARAECVESREREAALHNQVTTLETQASTLKKRLAAESDVADRETKKVRALEKKLADQQREWTLALRQKDEAMRREILATEERLHSEGIGGSDGVSSSSSSSNTGKPSPKMSPTANALVRTVDELNRKFVSAQNEWTAKLAEDQTKHRLEMLEQEERMQKALSEPREKVRELEDQVQNLQAEMCVMVKDVSVAKKKEQELQRRIAKATGEKAKLEEELLVSQQSIKAMSSMSTAGGESAAGGSAADQDARDASVAKATADSKIRQLNNEVDFLRAQLTSETTCRGDLETSLREITVRFQEAKEKWTKALREGEESHRREIRENEERFRKEMQAPRAEISRLEDKLQNTQRQLADIMKDLQLSQDQLQSTESTKRAIETELRATKETMDQRTQELAEVRFQIKQMSNKSHGDTAYRATSEATMRKLQNEVRYLQSQLTSESQCKEDLEHAISELRREMDEKEDAHSEELHDATRRAREEAEATLERESHLRDHKISLEGEVLNLSKQLTDLKKSYAKMRDQQRVDMQQLDATKKSAARLEVALQSARSELKRERAANEAQQMRHERAMAAVHQTVQDLTAAKKKALAAMEAQMAAHISKVGATQREMLELRDRFDVVQHEHQRRLGAERLGAALCVWQRTRKHAGFAQWKAFLTLDRFREVTEARHEEAMKDAAEDALEDKENTCKLLLEEYRRNKDQAMAEFARHHAHQLFDMAAMAQEDMASHELRALDNLEDALANAEENARDRLHTQSQEHDAHVGDVKMQMRQEMAVTMQQQEEAHAQTIMSVRDDAARTQEAALEHAASVAEQKQNDRDKAAAAQLAEAVTATEAALRALHDKQVAEINEKHERDMEARLGPLMKAREEMVAAHSKAMEELSANATLAQQSALEQQAKTLKQRQDLAIARQIAASQERINSIRDEEQKKRDETLREAARRLDEGLAAARHHAREKREAALAKAAAAHAAEMEKSRKQAEEMKTAALQYQTSKWQATLKECMVEAKRDKEAMRRQMTSEKEKALEEHEEKSVLRIADATKKTIAQCKKKEEEALLAAETKHSKAMKDLDARKQAALELALERARENAQNQLKQQNMDHEEVLRQRHAAHEEAMRGANEVAQTRLRAELESSEAKAAAERDAALRRAVAESKRRADTIRSECMKEKAAAMSKLQNEHNQVIAEITEAARIERKNALDELSSRAKRELDHAVERLEAQRSKQVAQLTDVIKKAEERKRELGQDIETLREQLEEAEDTVYDQKNALTKFRRVGAQQRLYLIKSMLASNREKKKLVQEATEEANAVLAKLKKAHEKTLNGMKHSIRGLEAEVRLHEETRNAMHDTLVNHKRAMLMEHKVQSSVLQQDLAALVGQKDEIEAQRTAVLKESSRLEGAVKEIEHQMHELSKVSAIQDGRINIAHAKKKRRLDQEFERMLSRTQDKRDHLKRIESKLQELDDKRQEKEDQMKELERNLVALLVEQQKRLLSIIRTDPKIGKKNNE